MRTLFLFTALLISTAAYAEQFLVFNVSDHARVVLSKKACLVLGLNGNAAVIQNDKGFFIQGCWHVDQNNSNHIRIDWNNPKMPGDFSVIEANKFESKTE